MKSETEQTLKKFGTCSMCHESKKLTLHHVLRKCWFHGGGPFEFICRRCHDLIELAVDAEEERCGGQLEEYKYKLITGRFLAGYYPVSDRKIFVPEFLRAFFRANKRRRRIRREWH